MNRRDFIKALGIGTGLAALPGLALVEREPVRRYWQVPGNAPVGAGAARMASEWEALQDYFERCASEWGGCAWVALHTSEHGGDPTEVSYEGYQRARVSVSLRAGWETSESIQFGECTAGTQRVTHVAVNGRLIPLDRTITVVPGVVPEFSPGALRIENG